MVLTIYRANPTKDQELVIAQWFMSLTMRRAKPNKPRIGVTQFFRALTIRDANPMHKIEDNFNSFK
ncbi:hypothetical protein [Thiothrix nivea]|uniref:hypothetical protein n=1 Tax=Thiothrix nivea TaxID=1031 RepID=UPI0012B694B2|nr:hypothetical protein [Thiothrix nivea]